MHSPARGPGLASAAPLRLALSAIGIAMVLLGAKSLYAQPPPDLAFEHFSTAHGLSFNAVSSLLQDQKGFLWVGTLGGLNRYDGYAFKVFKHDPADSTSLSDNYVNYHALHEDRTGALWIGTRGGLSRYDPATGRFRRYKHDGDDPYSLSHDNVLAIRETRAGTLWVGTEKGLNRYDPQADRFIRYFHDADDPTSLSADAITALVEDHAGTLWIGTRRGLNALVPPADAREVMPVPEASQPGRARFRRYRRDAAGAQRIPHEDIFSLFVDRGGVLWIGTWEGGLIRFDPATGQFRHYRHDPADPTSLAGNEIVALHADQEGHLWVGTWGGGVCRFDPASEHFTCYTRDLEHPQHLSHNQVTALLVDHTGLLWVGTWDKLNKASLRQRFVAYTYQPGAPLSLSHPTVSQVYEDREGVLWIGTFGGGLNRLDPFRTLRAGSSAGSLRRSLSRAQSRGSGQAGQARERGTLTHYRHDAQNASSLSHDEVTALQEDHTGALWIGTLGGGLSRYDRATGQFTRYRHDAGDPGSLSSDWIYSVYADSQGMLWIGTAYRGLDALGPSRERFIHHRHDPQDASSLSYDAVWPILEDHTGVLWFGTIGGGLSRYDRETGQFTRYRHDAGDPGSLSGDRVIALHEDPQGTLWVGTMGGGLNKLVPSTSSELALSSSKGQALSEAEGMDGAAGRFTRYTEQDGLHGDNVACILSDEAGVLWLSTSNGLSRFDPLTERFTNYGVADGLPDASFYFNACHRSARGEMFFGGYSGLVAFFPEDIRENAHPPPVTLTGFDLFNKPARLDSSITHIRQITLPYDQNFVAFHFAALDFTIPGKNRYAYRLDGIDKRWVAAGDRRYAGYPNLAPGRYRFRVKASNNDGVWNEEGTSVHLVITPPFWQTEWFRLVALVLFVGLVTLIYQYRMRQVRRLERARHEMHLQVERARHERDLALERTRQRIADDLHDDLGSTISGIARSLEMIGLRGSLKEPEKGLVVDAWQAVRALLDDLRDTIWIVDAQNEQLGDLLERMQEVARKLLQDRSFCFSAPVDRPRVRLEMALRRHVFFIYKELLHNAVRHARAPRIEITVTYLEDTLTICIKDDGIGFDAEEVVPGRGLWSLRARAEAIGADLTIESGEGCGTTAQFSVKIA